LRYVIKNSFGPGKERAFLRQERAPIEIMVWDISSYGILREPVPEPWIDVSITARSSTVRNVSKNHVAWSRKFLKNEFIKN